MVIFSGFILDHTLVTTRWFELQVPYMKRIYQIDKAIRPHSVGGLDN